MKLCPVWIVGLTLVASTAAIAQPNPPSTGINTNGARFRNMASTGTPQAIAQLDQAFGLLRQGDHDYQGHRARALHLVEAAGKELGTTLTGDGTGKETQSSSDGQLRSAQSLLQQALPGLTGRAKFQTRQAINQINIALGIK